MPKIEIKNLCYSYINKKTKAETFAIEDLSVVFEDGSFNVIIGESGCGKTTLLKLIAGLYDDYDGEIFIDEINGLDLLVKERNCAYVSQSFALYPHMSAFDNIAFPLKAKRMQRQDIINKVYEVADALDITYCLTRKPKYLSIGQQQRVAIGRSLVKGAKLYLYDEPLSNIDPSLRNEQKRLIKKVSTDYKATTIYVTHDVKEAFSIADHIYVMNEGKIVDDGTPAQLLKSKNEITKIFIEELNTKYKGKEDGTK